MLLVYTEKPLLTDRIQTFVYKKYPNERIVFVHSLLFSNISLDYNVDDTILNHLEIKPRLHEPKHLINSYPKWRPVEYVNNIKTPVTDIKSFNDMKNARILFAGDPASRSCINFSTLMKEAFNIDITEHYIDSVTLYSLDDESLEASFNNMGNFYDVFKWSIKAGKIKNYLDYNWNINSLILLNNKFNLLKQYNNYVERPFISKYSLQLLHFIAENPNLTENKIYGYMSYWPQNNKVSLGSCTSRTAIIDSLKKLNYIEEKNKRLNISKLGRMFLSLVPNSKDFALPSIIEHWMSLPFEEAKKQIDRYITIYWNNIE